MIKKFFSVLWLILENLPWMWMFLLYFAYFLVETAPTPWHARCVFFSVLALLILSPDVRK